MALGPRPDGRAECAITPHDIQVPKNVGPAANIEDVSIDILRTTCSGSLATQDPLTDYPLATLVNCAPARDGSPVCLVSHRSLHTRNMQQNSKVSLLLALGGEGDALNHPRLSIVGNAVLVDGESCRQRYLAHHPKSKTYLALRGFSFWKIEMIEAHLNAGPGATGMLDAKTLYDRDTSNAGFDDEPRVIELLNKKIAHFDIFSDIGKATEKKEIIALDLTGITVRYYGKISRIPLPRPVTHINEIEQILKN